MILDDYVHGGYPHYHFERLGINPRPLLDFSVSINPFGPPPQVLEVWKDLVRDLPKYPTICGEGVRMFYSQKFDISAECVLSGNGSTELMYFVLRVLPLRRIVIIFPSFYDYFRSAKLAGVEVLPLELRIKNQGFLPPSFDELKSFLKDADAIFLGQPNNPTATIFSREEILSLARRYPDKWFFVDESFIQFHKDFESVTLLKERYLFPNVLVFHSLTKFYTLAGLRIGAVLSHPETISRISYFRDTWMVNSIAEKVASILIFCDEFEEMTRRFVYEEGACVFSLFEKLEGFRIFPSSVNFFLVQWLSSSNMDELMRFLLSRGLYVRDCRNFRGLNGNFFRFALRKPKENQRLIEVLSAFSSR